MRALAAGGDGGSSGWKGRVRGGCGSSSHGSACTPYPYPLHEPYPSPQSLSYVAVYEMLSGETDRAPGDYGFDPLNYKKQKVPLTLTLTRATPGRAERTQHSTRDSTYTGCAPSHRVVARSPSVYPPCPTNPTPTPRPRPLTPNTYP